MRALEYLLQLYPNKTATEILQIQADEKAADQRAFEKQNKEVLAFIKDINTNGGYYRGKFGLDQHYYYNVQNMRMVGDEVMMDVDKIVLFCNNDNHQHTVCKPNTMHLEREFKEIAVLSQYGLDSRERITVKQWNEINTYLDAMSGLFWD